jgi:hypothetical protein
VKLSQLIRRADGWSDHAVAKISAANTDVVELRRSLRLEGNPIADSHLRDVRFTTSARGAAIKISRGLADLSIGQSRHQRALIANDILGLVCGMLAVFDWRRIEVRFEVAAAQSCPKFHCDNVLVRMLTTYVGPGTEYIQRDRPNTIHQASAGSLVFFKGFRHPTHANTVLHRSPPVRQGERRLTVVIDQAGWQSLDMPHSNSPMQTSEIA